MNRETALQKIREIEQQRKKYQMGGGGQKAVDKAHEKGKLTARERLAQLYDSGTFQELSLWAFPLRTGFEIDEKFSPGDAVAIGYGKVAGRPVMSYAHDSTVITGTQASVQHAKVTKVMETAIKMGVPYVGVCDSGGIRLQDRMGEPGMRPPADGNGMQGAGSFMYSPSLASGVIPQVGLMLGPQFAGASYSPIQKDFLIMREKSSFMALISPPVIKEVTGQIVTNEQLGGPMVHAKISGTCDMVVQSDEEGIALCKKLLSYWPSNWRQKPPIVNMDDSPDRREDGLLSVVPDDLLSGYDMHKLIAMLVDAGEITETKPLYGQSIITCFARMGGRSVGIVASNPEVKGGVLDMNTSDKQARFIRFCDAFNIPLVFLADTVGFLPDARQQKMGLERHAAKVMHAICEATVPKITVYIRNCSGYGELAMGTEQMGVDLVLAWPNAQIGKVAAQTALKDFYAKELSMENVDALLAKYNNIYNSGARNLFNDIIDPRDTRPAIIRALEFMENKSEDRPWRKHGNIPL